MVYSRFFAFFALFAVASAGRFLEEEDPCVVATGALQETEEYANSTAALFVALDDFQANTTGVCVIVDSRLECKGALPAEVLSAYEATCATMDGIIVSASNLRIVCDYPDTGDIYTVIESFPDCVSNVCTEDSTKDLVKTLVSTVDKREDGEGTFCIALEGKSGAFSAFSVGAVLMSLAAVWVF